MIQECLKCKVEFLTESDPYAVLPKPSGVELMCLDCIEKAFTLDLADRYEKEIEKRDKLLSDFLIAVTGTVDYGHISELRKKIEELKK